VAHVVLALSASGWPVGLAPKAWAEPELSVLPFQDVSSASNDIVLDQGMPSLDQAGELRRIEPSSGAISHAGRRATRPVGRGGGARSAAPRSVGRNRLDDAFTNWLRGAYGSGPSGVAPAGLGPQLASVDRVPAVAATDAGEPSAAATEDDARRGPSPGLRPPSHGRARPALLLPNWDCEYPGPPVFDSEVRLIATVRPDGTTESVEILRDPGHGFAKAAQECAMRQPFLPALDERGGRIRGKTSPFIVRFVP
jgi:hypothetical protein